MINVGLQIKKLYVLQEWLFNKIDGLPNFDLDKRFIEMDISYQLQRINKKKKPEEDCGIIITDHAYYRAKERLSMNRTSFRGLSVRAYENGVKQSDSHGNLKAYIDKLYFDFRKANNIRIYGENIFLFAGNVLLTVYQVPNNLRRCALKIQS